MLHFITYFFLVTLVVLFATYLYIEAQRKKIKEENKKAIALRVNKMKNGFKVELQQLVEQQILTVNQQSSAYCIANNFFVFQPINPNSIDYCQQLLNSVISAMAFSESDRINFDYVKEQVSLFISLLPNDVGGYKVAFYRNELPKLLKQLVNAKEAIYEIEAENSYQEAPEPEASTAA